MSYIWICNIFKRETIFFPLLTHKNLVIVKKPTFPPCRCPVTRSQFIVSLSLFHTRSKSSHSLSLPEWMWDMVRPSGSAKHGSAKLVLTCVGLLGFALVADFLWASSSRFTSSYSSIASNWASPSRTSQNTVILPNKGEPTKSPREVSLPTLLSCCIYFMRVSALMYFCICIYEFVNFNCGFVWLLIRCVKGKERTGRFAVLEVGFDLHAFEDCGERARSPRPHSR